MVEIFVILSKLTVIKTWIQRENIRMQVLKIGKYLTFLKVYRRINLFLYLIVWSNNW